MCIRDREETDPEKQLDPVKNINEKAAGMAKSIARMTKAAILVAQQEQLFQWQLGEQVRAEFEEMGNKKHAKLRTQYKLERFREQTEYQQRPAHRKEVFQLLMDQGYYLEAFIFHQATKVIESRGNDIIFNATSETVPAIRSTNRTYLKPKNWHVVIDEYPKADGEIEKVPRLVQHLSLIHISEPTRPY